MAGITPNPKKRSFLLPPGCKDLHDVLQRQRRGKKPDAGGIQLITAFPEAATEHDAPVKGQVSNLESHLLKMMESGVASCTLYVLSSDHQFGLSIGKDKDSPLSVSLALEIGTERNEAMRQFCIGHGLPLPGDTAARKWFFFPGLPQSQIYRLSPLPSDVAEAANLLIQLFQEVAGLSAQAEVYYFSP